MKSKMAKTHASTLQKQAQIQIPNLNGVMNLLSIDSNLSVILTFSFTWPKEFMEKNHLMVFWLISKMV